MNSKLVEVLRVVAHFKPEYICEGIWEKGPYRAKTKLNLLVETPVRVNPVQKVFFFFVV